MNSISTNRLSCADSQQTLALRINSIVLFRDDECRIRKDNAPANFATIKHIVSNLLRAAPGNESMRVKLRMAVWDEDFLARVIGS